LKVGASQSGTGSDYFRKAFGTSPSTIEHRSIECYRQRIP